MGLATTLFVISVLGYQLLSNCGVCEIQDCKAKLDMVIIVDSSLSVGSSNFKTVKAFIGSLVGYLPVQPDGIRVGIIRYASKSNIISYLDEAVNQTEKMAAVASMAYRGSSTYTHLALKMARKDVLTQERGDRPDVPDLVILITDGRSANENWTTAEAEALKANENLKIFVIGIGKDVADGELVSVATRPEMVYKLTDFSQLTEILGNLARFSCSDMKEESISELKTWSNSENPLILPTSKVSLTSKATSPSQPPSTATFSPPSIMSSGTFTSTLAPSTMTLTSTSAPSTMTLTSTSAPSTMTLTSTAASLTTTLLPVTSHSTNGFRSSIFLATLNVSTNKTTLTSREFDTTNDTVFLSTTQEQTPIKNEDLNNSSPTTQAMAEIIPSSDISTSESESLTESTLDQGAITDGSTLIDVKPTNETETQSTTQVITKDTSYSSSTDAPTDSKAHTSHHTATLLQPARNGTRAVDGARTISRSVQYSSPRTTSTSIKTTAEFISAGTDVTQSSILYITNFTQPSRATNSTFDSSVRQKSITTAPSLATQSTSVGISIKTSPIAHTWSSYLDNTHITTNKNTHRNNTLASTTSTASPDKTSNPMPGQSSTEDSRASNSHMTTAVRLSTRKSTSRTSTITTQTLVDTRPTQYPPRFTSTEPPTKHFRTTLAGQTTVDMNNVEPSVSPTQNNTVLAGNEAFEENENTSSINNTTIDYIHGQTGGDLSSRDVYIFIAGGSATAIVLVAMGTFLSVLCRRNSSRNLDAKP